MATRDGSGPRLPRVAEPGVEGEPRLPTGRELTEASRFTYAALCASPCPSSFQSPSKGKCFYLTERWSCYFKEMICGSQAAFQVLPDGTKRTKPLSLPLGNSHRRGTVIPHSVPTHLYLHKASKEHLLFDQAPLEVHGKCM